MAASVVPAGAATRYWTGAAEDGMFFNPANWSTRTASLEWADTLYFTNDAPITLSTASYPGANTQWPRYVYLQGADVIVKDGTFRLHGSGCNPPSFFDIAEGAKFVLTNSADRTSGGYIALNNYNGGKIVKKGRGSIELWARDSSQEYMTTRLEGCQLHVQEGEVQLRTTSNSGCYLYASEITVDEGAVLTHAGGYNSAKGDASLTVNGTLRVFTGGSGESTSFASLNGTGVITNTPWRSSPDTIQIRGTGGLLSAFRGRIVSSQVSVQLNQNGEAGDGYFQVTGADVFRESGGLALSGSGSPISFAAGIGTFDIGVLGVYSDSTTAVLSLEDADGEPVTLNASMTAAALGRLNTTGKGGLVLTGTEDTVLKGSKLRHEGVLSVCRQLTFGDGSDAANDFDFAHAPRRIEIHGNHALSVNNVNSFVYDGTLANDNASGGWLFYTPCTIARVERLGGLHVNRDVTINGGYLKSCYSFAIANGMTLTLSNVEASYSSSVGVNFYDATGSRLVFNGKLLDLSAYDPGAPMCFEQRGGEVRFLGQTYTPPTAATAENPATYLFDGGVTRFMSGTPFNSAAVNLLSGATGAKFRGDETASSQTARISVYSPLGSAVAAPGVDGGVEIDSRYWFWFRYPLGITGPFRLVGSAAMVDWYASFEDGTPFFGAGDVELDTSELGFYPRTDSKTVSIATAADRRFAVKGSSLLSARYRDPNSTNQGVANHFVIREPEFGEAGLLAILDRTADVGSSGASSVKLASGTPAMSASGRVLAPIVMGGKLARFTTYDATDGFKPFTGGVTAIGDCTASAVLHCSNHTTFFAGRTYEVEAIYCDDWRGITVPTTATVKIGDGTNPGMLLLAGQYGVNGGGMLDFRGAKAMIVAGATGDGGYSSAFDVKIANASSVNYLATIDEASTFRRMGLPKAQDYACETYVSGVRLYAKNTACFSTGRVHVMGGMKKGGQVDFNVEGTWANDFTVRGAGLSNDMWDGPGADDGFAALSFYADATLSGAVAVDEYARFSARTGIKGTFTGTVSGGRVHLFKTKGEIVFAGHNTYAGGTLVDGGTLTLRESDSAGTGAVKLANTYGTAVLGFGNTGAISFTNEVSGSGEIRVSGTGAVAFTGAWAAALPFGRFGPGTVLVLADGALVEAESTLVPVFDGNVDLGGGAYAVAGVSGSGSIVNGTLALAANGVISPGGEGAVGTLHFGAGVLELSGAATYLCEVGEGAGDRIEIEGGLSLSAIGLDVRRLPGGNVPKERWTVLTATGTLVSPFASTAFPRSRMRAEYADGTVVVENPGLGVMIIAR